LFTVMEARKSGFAGAADKLLAIPAVLLDVLKTPPALRSLNVVNMEGVSSLPNLCRLWMQTMEQISEV
jgi:hypothetical protein